jgi:hypothetical protein
MTTNRWTTQELEAHNRNFAAHLATLLCDGEIEAKHGDHFITVTGRHGGMPVRFGVTIAERNGKIRVSSYPLDFKHRLGNEAIETRVSIARLDSVDAVVKAAASVLPKIGLAAAADYAAWLKRHQAESQYRDATTATAAALGLAPGYNIVAHTRVTVEGTHVSFQGFSVDAAKAAQILAILNA